MQFETVPIDSISQDPGNLRRHDRKNLDAIKASLRRFHQQKVIVVDGNGVIRAGNGTYEAAVELGWEEIVIHRTSLVGSEATAYAISDNRTGDLSSFSDDELARTLASLVNDGIPLADVGFTDADLAALLKDAGPLEFTAEDGDETPLPPPNPDEPPPPSHVRMVQLFLNTETFPIFNRMVETLGGQFQTDNTTDTVMAVLKALSGDDGEPDGAE